MSFHEGFVDFGKEYGGDIIKGVNTAVNLFNQNDSGGGSTTGKVSQPNVPGYVSQGYEDLFRTAVGVADRPLEQYGGAYAAGITPNEQEASAAANRYRNLEFRRDYFDPARERLGGTTDFDERFEQTPVEAELFRDADLAPYLDPYTENVLNLQEKRRDAAQKRNIAQLGRSSALGGAFGGARHGIREELSQSEYQRDLDEMFQKGYSDRFQQATKLFGEDAARQMTSDMFNEEVSLKGFGANLGAHDINQRNRIASATAYGNLAGQQENIKSSIVNRLLRTGQNERQAEQARLTGEREKFDERFDYPKDQLNTIMRALNAASGVPSELTQEFDTSQDKVYGGLDLGGQIADLWERFFGNEEFEDPGTDPSPSDEDFVVSTKPV